MPFLLSINRFKDESGRIYTFEELPARIRKNVHKQEDGCWIWTGSIDIGGYGRVFVRALPNQGGHVEEKAHRYMYKRLVGAVPVGLELDHVCRVRACCNPAHMEPVTRSVNLGRGRHIHRDKTHCVYGHPLSGDNLYIQPSNGSRSCKICRRSNQQRWLQSQI